jgi:hypothetical protein
MLDPLTAVGLVANVLQFVDFGIKVVSKGQEIYRSAEGLPLNYLDFKAISRDLGLLTGQIERSLNSASRSNLSPEDEELASLSKECYEIARELSEAVKPLSTRPVSGPGRVFKSARQGFKVIWNKDKVDGIAERLRNYREALDTRILVSLR